MISSQSSPSQGSPSTHPEKRTGVWSIPFHPFLFALFPVLGLYAANFGQTSLSDIVLPCLAVLLLALALMSLRLVFPSVRRAAVGASYLLILMFSHMHFVTISRWPIFYESLEYLRFRYFLLIWLAAMGLNTFLYMRSIRWRTWAVRSLTFCPIIFVLVSRPWYPQTTTPLVIAVIVFWLAHSIRSGVDFICVLNMALLAMAMGSSWSEALYLAAMIVGVYSLRKTQADDIQVTRSLNTFATVFLTVFVSHLVMLSATENSMPLASKEKESDGLEQLKLRPPSPPRDIYYLVFDRYAGLRTLKEELGFDNKPFYDQLRSRGLHVAPQSRANYPRTWLSMSSAMNMRFHPERMQRARVYRKHFEYPPVLRLLKRQGYKYYLLGNWVNYLRTNKHADFVFRFSYLPSEFSRVCWNLTPFEPLSPSLTNRERIENKLSVMPELCRNEGPKFFYAHFILPHPPYDFNADGSPVTPEQLESRSEQDSYIQQLRYTNCEIIKLIDALIEHSDVPPVIVIQSDEGPFWKGETVENRLQRVRRRTDILSAFYFPGVDHIDEKIPDTVSPVNTFRLIFREYFNANVPLLEDRVFFWEHEQVRDGIADHEPDLSRPNRFVDVTRDVRAQDRSPSGR